MNIKYLHVEQLDYGDNTKSINLEYIGNSDSAIACIKRICGDNISITSIAGNKGITSMTCIASSPLSTKDFYDAIIKGDNNDESGIDKGVAG